MNGQREILIQDLPQPILQDAIVNNSLHFYTNNKDTVNWAAENGFIAVLEYLSYTCQEFTVTAMDLAAANGHLHVVQWLHENRSEGCTTAAMDGAAEAGHLEVVEWLHENRSEGCTTAAMDGAAEAGHLLVVQWLDEYRREGCSFNAFECAAIWGHLRVIDWLFEHRPEGFRNLFLRNRRVLNLETHVLRWIELTFGLPLDDLKSDFNFERVLIRDW